VTSRAKTLSYNRKQQTQLYASKKQNILAVPKRQTGIVALARRAGLCFRLGHGFGFSDAKRLAPVHPVVQHQVHRCPVIAAHYFHLTAAFVSLAVER
jgi:hypothetical protein